MRAALVALIACALAATAPPASAEDAPRPTLRLLPAWTHATPGADLELGLQLDLPDGWHVYWTNPGDSGMPTEATFTGPPGATFEPVRYPAPERIELPGGIVNYAYEGSTALLTSMRVPEDASGALTVTADARWLLCRELCVVQTGRAEAKIPVAKPRSRVRPANLEALTPPRSRVPVPLKDPAAWRRARTADGWRLEVAVDGKLPAELLPDTALEAALDARSLSWEDGAVVLRLAGRFDEDAPESVAGVLALQQHGGTRWLRIDVPLRAAAWADAPADPPPDDGAAP